MKAVIQRVRNASVTVGDKITGSINRGLLVYLGVASDDTEKDAEWMAEKVANLRIFNDPEEKMNLSIRDIVSDRDAVSDGDSVSDGDDVSVGVLTVSQFTLLADARKGRRPYYGDAASPEKANALYEFFMSKIREKGLVCQSGLFQARMDVSYTNEGPVTILLDSRNL